MRFADTIVYYYRSWRYRERPLPRIGVTVRAGVPGWVLRVVAAGAAVGAVWLAGMPGLVPLSLLIVVAGALGAWVLVWPVYAAGLTVIGAAGAFLLVTDSPMGPLIALIVVLAYLALRLVTVAGLVGWTGRAELAAILGWRDLVVLAGVLLVAAGASLPGAASGWLGVAGAAGLAGVGLLRRYTGRG